MFPKSKRIEDQNILDFYRRRRCDICGVKPSDPAHIKTRGSGGNDEHFNLLSLCRIHHTEQGQIGFWKMVKKYPFFGHILAEKGWVFNGEKKLRRE